MIKNLTTTILSVFMLCFTSISFGQQSISFGVYSSEKAVTLYDTYKPVLKALSNKMHELSGEQVNIKLRIFRNYEQGIDRLSEGKIDFMRIGPSSYILAKEKNPNIKLLAMDIRKGKKRFNGVIIAPSDSKVRHLSELKGKRFAFGSKYSTIGRYLAQAELMEVGIHGSDLSHYDYLGRHDKVAFAVSMGEYDAGAVKEKTYKKMMGNGIKALAYFDNVTKPWVASERLDTNMFNTLAKALYELKDKQALKVLKVDEFQPATDADYDFIRQKMLQAQKF